MITPARLTVLRALSGKSEPECACCRETRLWCLAIDHIAGGGRQERLRNKYASVERLVRREFRSTGVWNRSKYRVLCHNCNAGASLRGGLCPHIGEYDPRTEWWDVALGQ